MSLLQIEDSLLKIPDVFQGQAVLEMDSIEEKRKVERERYEAFRKKKIETGWFKPRYKSSSNLGGEILPRWIVKILRHRQTIYER
jgi:hypothetical protein